VSTYRWTQHGLKLGVSGHHGQQWIDAYDDDDEQLLIHDTNKAIISINNSET